MSKYRRVVFFGSRSDIDDYLRNFQDRIQTLCIAMNPSLRAYAQDKGLAAESTLPYFTNSSHRQALEKSKILVDWLRANCRFGGLNMNLQESLKDSFVRWARLSIHYCLCQCEIVANVLDRHRPQVVLASLSGKRSTLSIKVEPEEKFLGQIINNAAGKRNLTVEDMAKDSSAGPNWLVNYLFSVGKFVFKTTRLLLWQKRLQGKLMLRKSRPIFFTTKLDQLDKVAADLKQQLPRKQFYFLPDPVISNFFIPGWAVRLFWNRLSGQINSQRRLFKDLSAAIRHKQEFFAHRQVSFAQAISEKIENNLAGFMIGLMLWTVKLDHLLSRLRPAAFISAGGRFDDVILTQLCRQKNIPSILISHGSHVPPKNVYETIEWGEHGLALLRAPFSVLALQSPLAEAYLEAFPTPAKTARTGPLSWGRPLDLEASKLLFDRIFKGKCRFGNVKVVLHACTPKPANASRLYVYQTPDEYIQALEDLVLAIEQVPNAMLLIRFRSLPVEISLADLRKLLPISEKVLVNCDGSFTEALGLADLLVSFSSTTIEEALQNRVPVLLYGGQGRYQHVQATEIRGVSVVAPAAIYHVQQRQDLPSAIGNILKLNKEIFRSGRLFDRQIYPQKVRVALSELLSELKDNEGQARCKY